MTDDGRSLAPRGWWARAGWARAALLPLAAALFLLVGAALWAWGRFAHAPLGAPFGAPLGDRVWYAGLVLTGAPVVWSTLRHIARGQFASDVVAMLAVVTAVVLHQPLAGLVIVLMQSGGEALERYAEGRASEAVRALEAAAPRIAHLLRDGRVDDVSADVVAIGDALLVRPGELVPCDGIVVEGRSAVDISRLTGEPVPLDAAPGAPLPSGSANGEGPLTVRATAVARESQYARIVELVRSAQASKAPLQRLADRYAVWFTPATLLVCAVAWLWSGDPARVLAVLVVATPCPLILATPIAIIGGINRAARAQIIVRHGGALEQLAAATAAVFDKTGTLTIGHPEVRRMVSVNGWSERDLFRLAGAVEHGSGHLLARTLVTAAERALATDPERIPAATDVVEESGRGVTGRVNGRTVTVGARGFLGERHPAAAPALNEIDARFSGDPGLRAYIAIDGEPAGVVEYADRVRDDARRVMAELAALGIERTVLLSGDDAANVAAVASAVGVSDARSDLLPQDKVAVIRDLMTRGERVVMVGDGTNDAPAMSTATIGIALAAHGGGITAEAADVVLLSDDLARVGEAIRIGRRTMHIARQSLTVGLGLSAAAMVVAAFGGIQPVFGALLQEVIDVAVILNALRAST
ncbi:MAG TPA: heavy metal translocating P-type ATPase [Gemmatimonadaceae bacterium]